MTSRRKAYTRETKTTGFETRTDATRVVAFSWDVTRSTVAVFAAAGPSRAPTRRGGRSSWTAAAGWRRRRRPPGAFPPFPPSASTSPVALAPFAACRPADPSFRYCYPSPCSHPARRRSRSAVPPNSPSTPDGPVSSPPANVGPRVRQLSRSPTASGTSGSPPGFASGASPAVSTWGDVGVRQARGSAVVPGLRIEETREEEYTLTKSGCRLGPRGPPSSAAHAASEVTVWRARVEPVLGLAPVPRAIAWRIPVRSLIRTHTRPLGAHRPRPPARVRWIPWDARPCRADRPSEGVEAPRGRETVAVSVCVEMRPPGGPSPQPSGPAGRAAWTLSLRRGEGCCSPRRRFFAPGRKW